MNIRISKENAEFTDKELQLIYNSVNTSCEPKLLEKIKKCIHSCDGYSNEEFNSISSALHSYRDSVDTLINDIEKLQKAETSAETARQELKDSKCTDKASKSDTPDKDSSDERHEPVVPESIDDMLKSMGVKLVPLPIGKELSDLIKKQASEGQLSPAEKQKLDEFLMFTKNNGMNLFR